MRHFFLLMILSITPLFASPEPIPFTEGFLESNNAKIYYKTMGSGKPLVIIHGGPGLDHSFLQPYFEHLSQNHQLIFYDQRGTGNSTEGFDFEKINVPQFVEDLECLRAHLKLESFSIIAHSFGALLSTEYACKYPDHLKSMILLNSIPLTSQGLVASYEELKYRFKKSGNNVDEIRNSETFISGDLETVEGYYRELFKPYFYDPSFTDAMHLSIKPETPALQYTIISIFKENLFTKDYEPLQKLSKLQIPTYIIYSDHDFVPKWVFEEMTQKIPHSKSKMIQDCGHFSYVEKPKELLDAIHTFLTEWKF